MSKKQQLYWVKIALSGNLFDTVKVQTNNLAETKEKYLVLEAKPVKKQKQS